MFLMMIRKIDVAELPRVQMLAHIIWPACFHIFLSEKQIGAMLDSIYSIDALTQEIQDQNHQFWLASADGRDVGFASAYRDNDTIWIKKLYILPEMHGKGLGRALIKAAQEYFSLQKLALYVNEHNNPAVESYRRMGFTIKEKVPVTMGPYEFRDYVMVRR